MAGAPSPADAAARKPDDRRVNRHDPTDSESRSINWNTDL
jgi:hypothetical protein